MARGLASLESEHGAFLRLIMGLRISKESGLCTRASSECSYKYWNMELSSWLDSSQVTGLTVASIT